MLKQACPEEIPKQVWDDTFRVQHDIYSDFAHSATAWEAGIQPFVPGCPLHWKLWIPHQVRNDTERMDSY
jgi:hypothetical protein